MPDSHELSDAERGLEAQLAATKLPALAASRESMLYQAGYAAGVHANSQRGAIRLWRTSSAVMTAACVTLALLLWQGSSPDRPQQAAWTPSPSTSQDIPPAKPEAGAATVATPQTMPRSELALAVWSWQPNLAPLLAAREKAFRQALEGRSPRVRNASFTPGEDGSAARSPLPARVTARELLQELLPARRTSPASPNSSAPSPDASFHQPTNLDSSLLLPGVLS